jgi:hypothetical protein
MDYTGAYDIDGRKTGRGKLHDEAGNVVYAGDFGKETDVHRSQTHSKSSSSQPPPYLFKQSERLSNRSTTSTC